LKIPRLIFSLHLAQKTETNDAHRNHRRGACWISHRRIAALFLSSSPAVAQCDSLCTVGGAGMGGEASDGRAEGFHLIVSGHVSGTTATNNGNATAGRLVIDIAGMVIGAHNGAYIDGICRGSETGIFGDSEGLDPDCDE
jgi:hypothetical protein